MDKHVTKCGCCGCVVCTTIDDNDPVCSVCFKWANRLDAEALNKYWDDFKGKIIKARLEEAWTALSDLGVAIKHMPESDDNIITSLTKLNPVICKSKEYIERYFEQRN